MSSQCSSEKKYERLTEDEPSSLEASTRVRSLLPPITGSVIKVLLLPILFPLKYNRNICFTDNLLSYFFGFVCLNYVCGQPTFEARVRTLARMHAFDCKFDDSFPSWMRKQCPSLAHTVEEVTSTDGTKVKLNVVRPSNGSDSRIVLVFFHGGGMAVGSALNPNFRELIKRYGTCCTLMSPEYRVGIEGGKCPAGVDDCMAAVRHAAAVAGSGTNVILTGESAGGYLTIACGLRAKAEGLHLRHLLPIAPYQHIDIDKSRATSANGVRVGGTGCFDLNNSLTTPFMDLLSAVWVPDADRKQFRPEHDLRKADYAGVAPTTVVYFSDDILADEGVDIHARLVAAGVQAKLVPVPASHFYGCVFFFKFDEVKLGCDIAIIGKAA